MSTLRTSALVFTMLIGCTIAVVQPAVAQDQPADFARELAALREEVARLRAEVDALKTGATPAAPAPASNEMLQTQVAELAQVKVESSTKFPLKFFGTLHVSVFANSGNANWLDNPNLVGAPPADGHTGTMSASVRQTRLGFLSDGPTLGSFRTSAVIAMDFFGGIPGFQTGQVMGLPRLLVGFARIDNDRTAIEIGQDLMILAPRDPTSLAAFAFPLFFRSGNLYLRVPQVRVEQKLGALRASGGIVAPIGGDLVGDTYLFVPPALGGERSRRPAVQGRLAYVAGDPESTRWVDIGVSGDAGWERRPATATLARSWATALDASARGGVIGMAGELFVGDNIDAFGGSTGLDAKGAGGWGELQVYPTARLRFVAGYGDDQLRDARKDALARQRNQSAFSNITFSITAELQTAFEYRWLRTRAAGTDRNNHHFDWVFVHQF
jgi:hypothetical protein